MDSGKTSPNPTVVSDCAKERSEREHDVYIRRRKRDKEREVDSVRYEKKNEEYSTLALKEWVPRENLLDFPDILDIRHLIEKILCVLCHHVSLLSTLIVSTSYIVAHHQHIGRCQYLHCFQ
tara:strand:+ start:493 stop:855 length:363 start_codon:yes stop_codon:yes gene_type:complete